MTRKLLPYEYDLIDVLGVSKEEYLDFVAQQHIYKDAKEGTVADIRNFETVALILTIVGTILQVVGALLQKPKKQSGGEEQTRDTILAPRIGFNSTQELAKYGDTVPLVYTNVDINPSGGVRVSTLLVWSAILSFRSNQFMKLMTIIGASEVARIDPAATAIGQLMLKDLIFEGIWLYYQRNGPTLFNNLAYGVNDATIQDPSFTNALGYTAALLGLPNDAEGFSQAFSPTTSKTVGVTGFIPIRAALQTQTAEGYTDERGNNIDFYVIDSADTSYWPQDGNYSPRNFVPVGSIWELIIETTSYSVPTTDTAEQARLSARRDAASRIAVGGRYKIGTALFSIVSARYDGGASSIDENTLRVRLRCTRTGKMPRSPYTYEHWEFSLPYWQQREGNSNAPSAQVVNEPIETLYTKGLAQIDEASYVSVTACNVLDIALSYKAYRRINGRAATYGTDNVNYSHTTSDNGIKSRTAMFTFWYRLDNSRNDYRRLPYIFCCRGLNEQIVFTYIKFITRNAGPRFIEFKLEPVLDPFMEFLSFTTRGYCYLNPEADLVTLGPDSTGDAVEVYFNGKVSSQTGGYPPFNKSPKDTTEFDLFNYDAFSQSTFSFDQGGAEVRITAVNEQLIKPWSEYSPNLYKGLSMLSLHALSGAGTEDLRNVTAYVIEGKRLRPLSTALNTYGSETTGVPNTSAINALAAATPTSSTPYAPDIFLDTVIDKENGIGSFANLHSVDVIQLAQSKRFVIANNLFMDGLIGDAQSWRSFWSQVGAYSLLELATVGGKDTLIPAVPYNRSTGAIESLVAINALFNQGNILEGSLREEFTDYGTNAEDVIITVIYRDGSRNATFPSNASVQIKLANTLEVNAIRETIDASQFVTTRAQAIMIGKLLCNTRRYVRRSIEFQTFPTDSAVQPGSFIYVETSNNQWEGLYTGRVEAGGVLNIPFDTTIPNGTYNVLTYTSNSGVQSFNGVSVTGNTATALAGRVGDLFVLGTAVRNKRVFRIVEISMEEEGETTIKAVEHPCDANGNSLIVAGLTNPSSTLFTIS
jgi:hypothetical protein